MKTRERARVATAPRTSTFQMRINPRIRARAESVYADCGLTLTEAINLFIQQSLNVEGLPFVVTTKSRAAKFEQAVNRLMAEIGEGIASTAHERRGEVPALRRLLSLAAF